MDREKTGKLTCKRLSEHIEIEEIKIDRILNHFLKKLALKKNTNYEKSDNFTLDDFRIFMM